MGLPKIVIAALALIAVVLISGCAEQGSSNKSDDDVEEAKVISGSAVAKISKEVVIAGIDREENKCVRRELRLRNNFDSTKVSDTVEDACNGVRSKALEKAEDDEGTEWYRVKTEDGKSGWISETFVYTSGLCRSDIDCDSVESYVQWEEKASGVTRLVTEAVAPLCDDGLCVNCKSDSDCDSQEVCHSELGECVACEYDSDCNFGYCYPESYECVYCYEDSHCKREQAPYCNTEKYDPQDFICISCWSDDDCEDGKVCDTEIGRCKR